MAKTRKTRKTRKPNRASNKKSNTKGWQYIGRVAVDSGQLMIIDPCYLHNWKDTAYENLRQVKLLKNVGLLKKGAIVTAPSGSPITWEDKFFDENFSWNEAQKNGYIQAVEPEQTGELSYNGACRATLGKEGFGELNIGHATALVFRSFYGDGCYNVMGKFNKEGNLIGVLIDSGEGGVL